MIKMKKKKFVLLVVAIVIASLLAGFVGLNLYASAGDMILVKRSSYEQLSEMGEKYSKLYSMQKTINEQSLWETDESEQMTAIYKALVDSLGDKYSRYLDEEEYASWKNYVTGTFTGVGITFIEDDGEQVITKVLNGSPAASAGLKQGDIILKVDEKAVSTLEDTATRLRGEEGSKVTITYKRGSKEKTANLVRAQVAEQSVFSAIIDDKYGYIQITAFEETTADQFKAELAEMENKNVQGFILDLRNNLGGLVDAGVEIADMLLPECTITHTQTRSGEKQYYNSDENCTKLKYVLLVNENTASASEIVAAAIKDNKGGKLVGNKTFGKGIIQGSVEFSDNTAMTLTIMQYFSPNNDKIHEVGVEPDYTVKLKEKDKTDKQLQKAINLLS